MTIRVFVLYLLFITVSNVAYAVSPLPGSVEPGRVQQNFLPTPITPGEPTAKVAAPKEETTPVQEQAKKIKLVVKKIILKGNTVYSDQQIEKLYRDKLNKQITVADLMEMVQGITNYYRNNGYILSQALLPPQHIKDGIVKVTIIEGYIDQVTILGNPRGAKRLILEYGKRISESRPLQVKTMEHYMLLANMIPGTEVKAVLEPAKNKVGASDLNLVVQQQLVNASASYDNYGTRYLGPHQLTGVLGFNSIFLPGDTTRLTYLQTTPGKELRFGDVSYTMPILDNGMTLNIDGNKSLTLPGFVLEPLDTHGNALTYTATFQYPVVLDTEQNLTLSASISYMNADSTQLSILLYNDRIRPLQLGFNYTVSDSYKGANAIAFNVMRGLDIWNASDSRHSLLTSRFGADGLFSKFNLQIARNQGLFDKFSAYILFQGQYSFNPLLVEQQFGVGGSVVGRGYDPAEILGDRGIAGSVELRMDTAPNKFKISTIQYYAFYDVGKVWNILDFPDLPQNQSIASTGFGLRLTTNKYISGNTYIAQPLTKQVAAEEIVHKGRDPRIFFSLIAVI